MTQPRLDLPWNFPAEWDAPPFASGEVPLLAMEEGTRIIGVQVALVSAGMRPRPDPRMLKAGIACHRLGWMFEQNRDAILAAIRREKQRRGEEDI